MLLREVLTPRGAAGGDAEAPSVASGAAALASSRAQSQAQQAVQSSRTRYAGDTVQTTLARQRGLLQRNVQRNPFQAKTSTDLDSHSQAQLVRKSPFQAQSVNDLRLKAGDSGAVQSKLTYRQIFR